MPMDFTYKRLSSSQEVVDVIDWLNNNAPFIVLDLETTGLDEWSDTMVDIQLSINENKVAIFDAGYASLLTRLTTPLVGHNIKFDLKMLYRAGVDLTLLQWRDTLLIGHLLDENRESNSLDSYIQEYWSSKYKEDFWAKYKTYTEAPESDRWEYACADVHYTYKLYKLLLSRLEWKQKLKGLIGVEKTGIPSSLVKLTHDLGRSLLDTEIRGIQVDSKYLSDLGQVLVKETNDLSTQMCRSVEAEINEIEVEDWSNELDKRKTERGKAGVPRPEFSFGSTKQLQTLLYDKLGLEVQYNEKTKKVSTDEASLEKLEGKHPIITLLRKYREKQKTLSSFIEGTMKRLRPDGRIYPSFRVGGTHTGRISHSNPNLGQLPRSGGIRGMYIPSGGNVLISCDYSQLEVVLEANLTGDTVLAELILEGKSKHATTAEELGISCELAKPVNFAMQYWASHYKIAKMLGVSEEEGKVFWDKYWQLYKGPKKLKKYTDSLVDKGIPIVNMFGRHRRFLKRTRNDWDKDYRQAYNFLIQSTGADITSLAFVRIDAWLKERGIGRGLFTVHDEIIIEVLDEFAEEAEATLKKVMIQVGTELKLKIPLSCQSSGSMSRWLD